ncbi:MAG: 4'-phosphopantetheinyl transferase superfamily protein [Bryobacteraceae bacterium]
MTAASAVYREAHEDGLSRLASGETRLWCVSLDVTPAALARLEAVLDPEEILRANRFRFAEHRQAFVIARGVLRGLLAQFSGTAAHEVRFSYGVRGKPEFQSHCRLRFNLSHSGKLALYAFALDRELGVDIEKHREMNDLIDVAKRFFAPAEVSNLLSLPLGERPAAFFRCWTRKESFVKAVGDGLYLPLDSFQVSLRADEPAAIVQVGGRQESKWRLTDVTPVEGYSAALVTEGAPAVVTGFRSQDATQVLALLKT